MIDRMRGDELHSDEHDAQQICLQAAELEANASKQVKAGMYDDATRLLKNARRLYTLARHKDKAASLSKPVKEVMRLALNCVDDIVKNARQKLSLEDHTGCVSTLQHSILVLKWLEANPAADKKLVEEASVALKHVGELHVEAEWDLADKKLKSMTQYAARLHYDHEKRATLTISKGVSVAPPRSFKPVRKAVTAARDAYLRLLDEPWLPHRKKTLKKLSDMEKNPHFKPPDPESELEEAVALLNQGREMLESGQLDAAREATMEMAQILSVADPTEDRAVQSLIMEVMVLEHHLILAQVQASHRAARKALLLDNIPAGMKACSDARLKLNDLIEEAHNHQDEQGLHELIQVAQELDETQGRLTVARDLRGSKVRLTQALEHLQKGVSALAEENIVMAEVEVARSENLVAALKNQHTALVDALGSDKLEAAEADIKELKNQIDNFSLRDDKDGDGESGDEAEFDRIIREINVNATPSADDDEDEMEDDHD